MIVFWKNKNRLISVVLIFFFPGLLFPQTKEKKKVYIGNFQAYKSPSDSSISEKIIEETLKNFKAKGINAQKASQYSSISEALARIKSEEGAVFLSGYYKKVKDQNLEIFAQIYNPETGFVIDALNVSEELTGLTGIKLPEEETKESDNLVISKFVSKIVILVKINTGRKERTENVNEFLGNSQLGKDISFPIRKEDVSASAASTFKFLEDIEVVTATRTKTKIKDAPAAVYVVTAQQIRERGYQTIEDALHDIPGFDFQHTNGLYYNLAHQRGLIGNMQRTLLYVDGIPDNNLSENAMLGGSYKFPLANVERIEVVAGPASSLYGANAFNGIINIITKDGITNPGNHVDTTYGYWEPKNKRPGQAVSLSARGNSGGDNPIQYSVGAYYYQSIGPDMGGIQNLNPPKYGATTDNPNYNYKYDPVYSASKKMCGNSMCNPNSKSVGYYWSPAYNNSNQETYNITAKFSKGGFRFETIHWQYIQGEGTFANGTQQLDTKQRGLETGKFDKRNLARLYGIASGMLTNTETKDDGTTSTTYGTQGFSGSGWNFRNNTALIGYLHKITDTLSLDSEATVRHTEILSTSHEEEPKQYGPGGNYRPGDVNIYGNYSRPDNAYFGEERLSWNPSSNFSTIAGVMAKRFQVAKNYGSYEQFVYNNYAVYIQQMWRPIEKLALTGGFRRDYITTYGYASTPRLSAVFTPTKDLTFKLLYGTAFREPSGQELFSQTGQRKPNPDLKPEKLNSIELGAAYRFLKNYYTSVQAFSNEISNLILEVATTDTSTINGKTPTAPWNQNNNLGKARIHGIEADANAHILSNLNISINYTYMDGIYYDLPKSLQKSPSTAGRAGDDPAYDVYLQGYKELTGAKATVPSKGAIPSIAKNKGNLGVTYYIMKNLSIYLGINWVDVRRTISSNPEKSVPGYKFFRLNIRWEDVWKKGMFLQFHVNNLTNEQFFDPGIRAADGGYYPTMHPMERRNIWFSAGYHF
ncbi:MAG: TonB-dependent receptor [Leptospiraceae bacterium]|nr:TonB-dependent receptor [Leptospiraceae bacterium]NUM40483.1 TonB-dependent receptor [Leptospiraceae bacterium]